MLEPRGYAAAFLLIPLAVLVLICRALAARVPKPAVVWAAGGYLAFLHLICLYGLPTSTRFDSGLSQLTLFTFPFSVLVGDSRMMQGFATLPDLAANYLRYVLCFGGLNSILIAGFLALVAPRRTRMPDQTIGG